MVLFLAARTEATAFLSIVNSEFNKQTNNASTVSGAITPIKYLLWSCSLIYTSLFNCVIFINIRKALHVKELFISMCTFKKSLNCNNILFKSERKAPFNIIKIVKFLYYRGPVIYNGSMTYQSKWMSWGEGVHQSEPALLCQKALVSFKWGNVCLNVVSPETISRG